MKTIASLFAAIFILTGCATTSGGFQQDADVVRLKHLEYYGGLIEEYHSKTGEYPLQGRYNIPAYVHVAHDKQIKYTKQGPPYKHEVIEFKQLVSELESVLGRDLKEFYDPQFAPDSKPNFYIYLVLEDRYYFDIHIHQAYAFSKPVAKNYHKVEISSNPGPGSGAKKPESLFSDPAFITAKNVTVSKAAFFDKREALYLRHTKQ